MRLKCISSITTPNTILSQKPDDLAVLGVMLDVPSDENIPVHATFGAIINQLKEMAQAGEEKLLQSVAFDWSVVE